MKKVAVCLLLFLLTGCSNDREINEALALRSRLLQSSECFFTISAETEHDKTLFRFSMDCSADRQGNISFSVTEPESISGIDGKLSGGNGVLTFEDTALDLELLSENLFSPVAAPWILMKGLRSGYISSVCMEEGMLRMSVEDQYGDEELKLDVWLNSGNLPEHADILHDGLRILSLDIENFDIL